MPTSTSKVSVDCCCGDQCVVVGKKCDHQHKCFGCKQYLHAICGKPYYDKEGNVVEDLVYPRMCFKCHDKERKVVPLEKEGEHHVLFTASERMQNPVGWYKLTLNKDENILDRFKIPDGTTQKNTKIVGKWVHIPAAYFGESIDTEFWKVDKYDKGLHRIGVKEMRSRVVFIGKVVQKVGNTCDVALLANKLDDEVSGVHSKDIRNFISASRNHSGLVNSKMPGITSNKKKIPTSDGITSNKKKIPTSDDITSNKKKNKSRTINYNSDELVEDDESLESGLDLQESEDDVSDESSSDESSSDDSSSDDEVFERNDARCKVVRKWTRVEGVRTTLFTRVKSQSCFLAVSLSDWEKITCYELFMRQLPTRELEIWSLRTSEKLRLIGHRSCNITEMKQFVGVLLAMTQTSKVGGISKAFDDREDGLFPAHDLGKFGLSFGRFKQLMQCWTFANESEESSDNNLDPYWSTDQLISRFNQHYQSNFSHAWQVNVDERIFWSFARYQPDGTKMCGMKPRGTGQEFKTLSATDVHVTTTFEQVRSAAVTKDKDYAKIYRKAAAVVMRLCAKAGINGSNRVVIAFFQI